MSRTMSLLIALVLLAAGALAQSVPDENANPRGNKLPSSDDLRLKVVEIANVERLHPVIDRLFGRDVIVVDQGSARTVHNLMLLGDRLLIHDLPDRVDHIRQGIVMLDEQTRDEPVAERIVQQEIRLEHVSIKEALEALGPLARTVQEGPNQPNVTPMVGRNLLFIRDREAQIAEMRRIIAIIDRPQPQVMIRCRILKGCTDDADGADARLAQLIPAGLRELTRLPHFEVLAAGAIRSTTAAATDIEMQMSGEAGLSAQLRMTTAGYSDDTRTLRLGRIEFAFLGGLGPDRGGRQQHTLRTATTLADGEVVAIGALGEDPIFVILEMNLIDG